MGGNKGYFKDTTARNQIETANEQIVGINNTLLPIDSVVKKFWIYNGNTNLDTGINVNQMYTTGFVAIVSTFATHNAGVVSVYIGGVAYRKQDRTVGDISTTRLGGVGIGGSTDTSNLKFSVVNDKLQIGTYQYQVGACITLIVSRR